MFEWLQNYSQVVTTLTNFGLLLVWVAYLQLFFQSLRRQRRAHILINRGGGTDLGTRCLIGNMTSEAIYLESIIARIHTNEDVLSCAVTDLEVPSGEQSTEGQRNVTRQGPLSAGDYLDIGSFKGLLDRVMLDGARSVFRTPDHVFEVEMLVIADYASENLVVGARRRFEAKLNAENRVHLKPCSAGTEQIRKMSERRKLEELRQKYF